MKLPTLNGNTKIAVSIAFAFAVLGAVFAAGMSWSRVEAHVSDTSIHEDAEAKQRRIDDRIDLHLRPIQLQLREMDKKIDRIDSNVRDLNRGRI